MILTCSNSLYKQNSFSKDSCPIPGNNTGIFTLTCWWEVRRKWEMCVFLKWKLCDSVYLISSFLPPVNIDPFIFWAAKSEVYAVGYEKKKWALFMCVWRVLDVQFHGTESQKGQLGISCATELGHMVQRALKSCLLVIWMHHQTVGQCWLLLKVWTTENKCNITIISNLCESDFRCCEN